MNHDDLQRRSVYVRPQEILSQMIPSAAMLRIQTAICSCDYSAIAQIASL